eukprot:m.58954 g.58954  ORF g.58954 m.58954 type:complete len:79 (-) comp6939_c0_seq2:58-294(-)
MSVVSESADECLREPTKFAREYLSKCQGLFDSRTMGVDTLEVRAQAALVLIAPLCERSLLAHVARMRKCAATQAIYPL